MRNRHQLRRLLIALIGLLLLSVTPLGLTAQPDPFFWSAWENKDIAALDDDNSGATFAASEIDGEPVLMVTPGGSADETKLALPVTGAELPNFATHSQVVLDMYLPETNALNPNTFFMGMADVTGGGFTWIAGIFSGSEVEMGWNHVIWTLHPAMRDLIADHDYMIYFSAFHTNAAGGKTPLTEPFYIGHGYLTAQDRSALEAAEARYRQEVAALLEMDDTAFVGAVARHSFDFFWQEANPENGLVKDRSTPDSVASIAAVGFGLAALPVGVERGWITADAGYQRALTTLRTFVNGGVQGEHGFFYHFVSMATGNRVWESELSSIDTALLVAGAVVAGQYFAGTEVQTLADQLYANVEWDWMLGGGRLLKMGWTPEGGFLNAAWDHFDESLLLYALAFGSPTHPIDAAAWAEWRRPVRVLGDDSYIYLPGEPLFVYQYPLAYLDLRGKEDHYANYFNNTARACERNYQYGVDNSGDYATYDHGVWGLSASDGPHGYRAYGASEVNNDGTIAPYASAACLPFTPEIALSGMRALLTEYGERAWREYGFVSAINEAENWYSRDHIGIDVGDTLLMLVNHQDGFVWELFMANPNIQNALDAMGFVASSGDYAVTPAYLAEYVVR